MEENCSDVLNHLHMQVEDCLLCAELGAARSSMTDFWGEKRRAVWWLHVFKSTRMCPCWILGSKNGLKRVKPHYCDATDVQAKVCAHVVAHTHTCTGLLSNWWHIRTWTSSASNSCTETEDCRVRMHTCHSFNTTGRPPRRWRSFLLVSILCHWRVHQL